MTSDPFSYYTKQEIYKDIKENYVKFLYISSWPTLLWISCLNGYPTKIFAIIYIQMKLIHTKQ